MSDRMGLDFEIKRNYLQTVRIVTLFTKMKPPNDSR
jgi:hypothetical protein